jgi:ABC-2 type transport system permease protein
MWRRLGGILSKEFRQMFRDVRMRLVIFAFPVVQLTVLAFALTTDVKDIRFAVFDEDRTPTSRRLVAAFAGSGYFQVTSYALSYEDITNRLDSGTVQSALRIPHGFEADVAARRQAQIQILTDGTYNNDTAIVFNYAQQIVADFNRSNERRRQPSSEAQQAFELSTRSWYNPNLNSKFYYVPGLIAVMLLIISMLLTSIAIVREKEIGTIEQVMVTPIRRFEFIIGKTLPYLMTGLITMTNMLLVAWPVFGLVVQGSILLLYVVSMIYIFGNLGIALLISVSAKTQQQAMLTTFLILLPSILLSGFIFPIRNMPWIIQILTHINPVRWFLENLHGIVVRGVGFESLRYPILAQAVLASLFSWLAVVRFKKTLA